MSNEQLVAKVWNYAHVLRDQGISYGDYVEQITFLLFLKMDHERVEMLGEASAIPTEWSWPALAGKDGDALELHYRHTLEALAKAVVTRLDRLARSGRDLHDIIAQLSAKQVGFRCVQQGAVDTTTSMGKLILGILGAVAEFETDIRKERQREGIERAKAAGVYKGRKRTVDCEQVRSLHDQGLGATDIATKLGIARASVYRALNDPKVTTT